MQVPTGRYIDMKSTKRQRNLYEPGIDRASAKPYKLSRSALELFVDCPRCFYIDRRLGVGRPPGFPFNLNSAVDQLLKKEFDLYRIKALPHPLMLENGVEAIPFAHPSLEKWRENFVGIQHLHHPTNLMITGAVDDIWVNSDDELIVVDYKSTAKKEDILELNQAWHGGYKRQMEVYQWLLRQIGFKVSPTAYWVYANGDTAKASFDAKLHFRMTVIAYAGDDSWVEPEILRAKACLDSPELPKASEECGYCNYRQAAMEVEQSVAAKILEKDS
jgi:hypothetical protein